MAKRGADIQLTKDDVEAGAGEDEVCVSAVCVLLCACMLTVPRVQSGWRFLLFSR